MKIVLAPNAFKGSLTAERVAEAMCRGVQEALPDAHIVAIPVADGGDGLLQVLQARFDAQMIKHTVSGPLGIPVEAEFLYSPQSRLAVIEMAAASGLTLLRPDQYNPMLATTRGVGELILAAAELGAQRIILGLGGSATNDGGMGMASALGVRFTDSNGHVLAGSGAELEKIRNMDMSGLHPALQQVAFQTVCDVDNPLLGETGASRVFGPQKGADQHMLNQLEAGLENFARVIEQTSGRDFRHVAGAGAAGGMGAGSMAFLNATLLPGAELVLNLLDFDTQLAGADLVITGEGELDSQTCHGKAPAEVARRAHALHVPCIAMAGRLSGDLTELHSAGLNAAFSICPGPVSLSQAMENAGQYLVQGTAQAVLAFVAGQAATKIA